MNDDLDLRTTTAAQAVDVFASALEAGIPFAPSHAAGAGLKAMGELLRVIGGQIRRGRLDRREWIETIARHRDVDGLDLSDARAAFREAREALANKQTEK